ncbi:hypothetical protein K445DRAFT_25459 [Daldinia sp. EC12]|nr:hypothetical protein K445DRAFT_25459 [Daldinia sp. EC12]
MQLLPPLTCILALLLPLGWNIDALIPPSEVPSLAFTRIRAASRSVPGGSYGQTAYFRLSPKLRDSNHYWCYGKSTDDLASPLLFGETPDWPDWSLPAGAITKKGEMPIQGYSLRCYHPLHHPPLNSSMLDLVGFDANFAPSHGQIFVDRMLVHSLFYFRVDVDWASSLDGN